MFKRMLLWIVGVPTIVLALAAGTSSSVGAQPTSASATLGNTAILVAKGAAIDVPVIYSCSPDTAASTVSLFVTERVPGNRVAFGSASTFGFQFGMICDEMQRTAIVTVMSGNDIAFHNGTGVVRGGFEFCDANGSCVSVTMSGLVKIVKK